MLTHALASLQSSPSHVYCNVCSEPLSPSVPHLNCPGPSDLQGKPNWLLCEGRRANKLSCLQPHLPHPAFCLRRTGVTLSPFQGHNIFSCLSLFLLISFNNSLLKGQTFPLSGVSPQSTVANKYGVFLHILKTKRKSFL